MTTLDFLWLEPESFRQLFTRQRPILDLRAPAEFAKGAFPGAINIPLMDDDERAQVGRCYKQHGQQAAINLGHRLVSGDTKQRRIDQWLAFFQQYPDGVLYCFRGGLRSQIVQQWLADNNCRIRRVRGGYKALRRYLIDSLEQLAPQFDWVVLAGRTGCDKTQLIQQRANSIDLEHLAHHRGSAFGHFPEPQPTQIDFENQLSIELLKRADAGHQTLFIEDEGSHIGSISIPEILRESLRDADVEVIEKPLEQRIDAIYRDYVHRASQAYPSYQQFSDALLKSLAKTRKRLGDKRYQQLHEVMRTALDTNSEKLHKLWIEQLLTHYYDPMYDYQLHRKNATRHRKDVTSSS
ncbi:tRNA 2-selenouridine(34) synthase MnmH [Idiomarina seosinensis]|uniref:tRNA 2-selenouridine synthase n=1 Tax=Idiomarina seosinensis TaxID=281739 RepID=A0A432ZHD8_9GAMM|nr:tRNA 2-selenouridine(34) synthase MnmH [Idiomarina seosinensis]RUO77437.1 tRNA 2-selenouridine(34) synthase MnmH [Idiomarina seosinensis]